jgi:hypothetical protein
MWRTIRYVSATSVSLWLTAAARSQDVPATESLASELKWVQFEIVLGRVAALNPRYHNRRSEKTGDDGVGVRQSMSISADAGAVSVHYELLDPQQRLTVDLVNGGKTTMVRESRNGSAMRRVRFVQGAKGGSTLVVEAGGEQREYCAADFWRLMLTEPRACREHLVPILEFLRPNWQLAETAEQIQEALFQAACSSRKPLRRRLQLLVDQLGSKDFRRRQAADRELRSFGQAAMPFFDEMDEAGLDAEQRLRIRRIRAALAVQEGDTPLRVAAWLIDDKSIWLALMNHEDPSRRALAATELGRVCGQAIDFDPLADPSQRSRQIARLRVELADQRSVR